MRTRFFPVALALILLTGCSTTVTFVSDIEGASVTTKSGQSYGLTPVSVQFSSDVLDASRQADGCARIPGVRYRWPSGAQADSPDPIVLCGNNSDMVVRVDRPTEAPGTETDMKNALERLRQREAALRHELDRERLYNEHRSLMMPGFFWAPLAPMHAPAAAEP